MIKLFRFFMTYFIVFLAGSLGYIPLVSAQSVDNAPSEELQIIVTTDTITIGTNFTGTDLYIAGVIENANTYVYRQNGYNLIVTLEGPNKEVVMREKKRRLGIWVNADSITFKNMPLYYALAATRELRDITTPETLRNLYLGTNYMSLYTDSTDADKITTFRQQLIRSKKQQNLYSESIGSVSFGQTSLFKARFQLPSNLPVGNYKIRAYLFREGVYIDQTETSINIRKAYFSYSIFRLAHQHSLWYGLIAVLLAIFTGFAGRMFFRHD